MYVSADPLLTIRSLRGHYPMAAESILERQVPPGSPFLGRGRVALWALLRTMGLGAGHRVLIPSYVCDSVLGPIEAIGAQAAFYRMTDQLGIDHQSVETLLDDSVRAVLAVHYFGLPSDLTALRELCNARNVWLIEDCAHALFSFNGGVPLGRAGHASVFSPWKSLPIPDGGILVLNDPRLVRPDPLPPPGSFAVARSVAYRALPTFETLLGWSPRTALLAREGVRRSIQERDRNPHFAKEAGSDFSYQVLHRTDGADVRARRRANYRRLAMAAASQPYLQPMASSLPDGVCPLGLPVLALNREASRAHFLRRGINVRAYWERLPREVRPEEFPESHRLSERILILPVHQSMTERQVDHVIRAIHEHPERADA